MRLVRLRLAVRAYKARELIRRNILSSTLEQKANVQLTITNSKKEIQSKLPGQIINHVNVQQGITSNKQMQKTHKQISTKQKVNTTKSIEQKTKHNPQKNGAKQSTIKPSKTIRNIATEEQNTRKTNLCLPVSS